MNNSASQSIHYFSTLLAGAAKHPLLCIFLVATFGASLTLFWPVLEWFVLKMSMANGWLHILAFSGLCGIGFYRITRLATLPLHAPCFSLWPTVLWLSAGFIYLLNEAHVGFNTLSAALFIIFVYGLSGYLMRQRLWRSLFIPTALLILVLPFEHYLDIYLGFPLRLLSAQWAASILQHTGLPLLTTESILMIDNRAAIVDLDCSGIKSLWIGLIFYLLLTWIERYRIGGRWLLSGCVYLLLLIMANVARITVLVLLELVLEKPEIAGLLHQTLGLLGFGISSAIIWWLMPYFAPRKNQLANEENALPPARRTHETAFSNTSNHANKLTTLTLCLIVVLNLLYQPQTVIAHSTPYRALKLPDTYALTSTPLNPQEQHFFSSNQSQADKYQITLPINGQSIRVAMVLVWSRAWKTHHVPENCYLSQGFSIDDQGLWQLPQQALRYLHLSQPQATKKTKPLTALYWFQSATHSTPNYSARVMDNLFHPNRNWVMVSLLFEHPVTPQQITPFTQTLTQAIGQQFSKPVIEEHFHEHE